jgi:hypothetical protein
MKAFDWQLQKKGYIPMSGQLDTRNNLAWLPVS